jgi:hypothetical protein
MHKRTIRLAISAIMLTLVVSVPMDAAGQERAGLRQRQQQQRERAPRDATPRARSAPRDSAPRDSRARRRTAPRNSGRRGVVNNGLYYGRWDYGRRGFGRRGYGIRSLFPIYLGAPLMYPNYNFNPICARRGGVWVEREVYIRGRYILREICVEVPRYRNY